jgi:putative MATE family efflux protein
VIFGYLLAFGVGFLPTMGVGGISLGGSTAATMITLCFVVFWWRGRFQLKPAKRARINLSIARQMLTMGLPSVLEQGFVQLAFLAFFAIVAQYGTTAYAAYGIGISLVSFSIVIGFGFGIAAATLVGQQLGAGKPELAVKAGWRGLRMAIGAMLVFSIVMSIFAEELASFMISDPEAIHLTSVFIYIIAVCQPLMAVDFALAGALRGAGDTRFPLLATTGGILFGRLLPALLFLKMDLSIYWVLSVMVSDYAIKATLLLYRYRSQKWVH